jgi:hypothetical protein
VGGVLARGRARAAAVAALWVLAPVLVLASCAADTHSGASGARTSAHGPASARSGTLPVAWPGTAPVPTAPAAVPPTPSTPTTAVAAFAGAVHPIDDATRARMSSSWRPGCPVPLDGLRLLTLRYWGYDGAVHDGELVVAADQADRVVDAFRGLFEARFPIERMQLVDLYGGDDHASTLANNTAGFNCREVVGRPGSWSEHAYGRAIDVNPLVNPYLLDPHVGDPELARYVDRTIDATGLIRPGDAAVSAFTAVGWQWGGVWSPPDYQHFSATGH